MLVFEFILFLVPLCFARVMDSSISQENGKSKNVFRSKQDFKPALQPTLHIRNSPPQVMEVKAGESTYLQCEAGGTPPPIIHWLKDGERVYQTKSEMMASRKFDNTLESKLGLGFTRSRLFLNCATPDDAGTYTCVAENEYMRDFKDNQVTVTGSSAADVFCFVKKTLGSPAKIHMWTHTRLEMMETDVQLFCRSQGNPQPKVEWRGPNDMPLTDPKKYEILPNGDLIIRHILWTDMGGYICQVRNSEGSDEAVVFLYPTLPGNGSGY